VVCYKAGRQPVLSCKCSIRLKGFVMEQGTVFDQMVGPTESSGSEFDWIVDPEFARKFPNLNQVLFAKQNHGKEREPGKLYIFVQEGSIKVCLVSPSEGLCGFSTLSSLENLLPVIEGRLAKGTIEWRKDKKHGRSR